MILNYLLLVFNKIMKIKYKRKLYSLYVYSLRMWNRKQFKKTSFLKRVYHLAVEL